MYTHNTKPNETPPPTHHPISAAAKSVLWVILFGLAKTFQYGGITILGAEGVKRIKQFFRRKKKGTHEA